MGSFASTCCISGLPLEAGEPVHWLLLMFNPYQDNLYCDSTSTWVPRTFPLRAKYNNYGSIEGYDLNDPALWATLHGMKRDVCERGWGENMCHDVPVSKSMTFDDLLTAVWEGRVRVRNGQDAEFDAMTKLNETLKKIEQLTGTGAEKVEPPKDPDQYLHVGFPSRKRVEKLLTAAGFNTDVKGWGQEGFVVNGAGHGKVRVRTGKYASVPERIKMLEAALPLIKKQYAAMIRCGTGRYSTDGAEIIIMPKPDPEGRVSLIRREPKPAMAVTQAMIHSDVWNALLELKFESNADYTRKVSYDMTRNDVQTLWDDLRKPNPLLDEGSEMSPFVKNLIRKSEFEGRTMHSGANYTLGTDVLGTVGVPSHFRWLAAKKDLTATQVDQILDDAAGYTHISRILSTTRYWWRPSYTAGPQFGEYMLHVAVNKAFAAVADNIRRRRDCDD